MKMTNTNLNNQFKKDFFWNAVSSLTNGFINLIISFFVINTIGTDMGGIFGFGFSTLGQQVFIVSYFGVRIFQITDVGYQYDFTTYRKHRIITSSLAVLFLFSYMFFYLHFGIYDIKKCIILVMICIFKMIEGFFDVYECEFQRSKRLYLACQFNFFRVFISTIVLIVCIYLFKNIGYMGIVVSLCLFVIFQIAFGSLFINNNKTSLTYDINSFVSKDNLLSLTKKVLPLFIITFLDFWIFSLPKYALDLWTSDYLVGIFNILFMPASLIYLFVNFFLRPFLSILAEYNDSNDEMGFKETSYKMYKIAVIIAIVCLLSAIVFGGTVLNIIDFLTANKYSEVLQSAIPFLIIIILGGFMYALVNVRYSILTVQNKQNKILACYVIILIVAIFLSNTLVFSYGMYGAAVAFLLMMSILFGLLMFI